MEAAETKGAERTGWRRPVPDVFLTGDVLPIGGRIKERPEDFLVEEIPAYQPSGEGEHIYLLLEKRGLSTSQLVHLVARHFGVPIGAVGFAGMKDKHAVTRQVLSVHTPGKTFRDYPDLRNERVGILNVSMHGNKLRLGHLAGNSFAIKIRGVDLSRAVQARNILKALERSGVPNFAGEQRFGSHQNNHILGRHMLLKQHGPLLDELLGPDPFFPELNAAARAHYAKSEFTRALDAFPPGCRYERAALAVLERGGSARKACEAVDALQQRFWFSAFQSALFNRVLARRITEGRFGALEEGDLAWKHDNGAVFAVDAPTLADPSTRERFEKLAISPSGPVWGGAMTRASGRPGADEAEALEESGVPIEALEKFARGPARSMRGGRRPLRVPLARTGIEGGIDEHGHYVRVSFDLPPGAFATTVLREIMKTPEPGAPGGGDDGEHEA